MTVDFSAWAVPSLVLKLGERTYTVRPPSVADMTKVLACAVRAEVNLGFVKGPVPTSVQEVLDTIAPTEHPALTSEVYDQMIADGQHPTVINRMGYYAVLYWARSKAYADAVAAALWTPREPSEQADGRGADLPKAPPTSPRSSGRGTGSATRSTKTRTASPSSRTTGSPST